MSHLPSSMEITAFVISLSKIRDCDWSYTRHVICKIITVDRCSGQHNLCLPVQRSTLLVSVTSRTPSHAFAADFWSERYIRHVSYIFCAA